MSRSMFAVELYASIGPTQKQRMREEDCHRIVLIVYRCKQPAFASASLRGGGRSSRVTDEDEDIDENDDLDDLESSRPSSKRTKRFPKPTPRDWAVLNGEITYDNDEHQATAWYYALQKVLDNRTVVVDGKKVLYLASIACCLYQARLDVPSHCVPSHCIPSRYMPSCYIPSLPDVRA